MEEVHQVEFCGLSYQMLFAGKSKSFQYALLCQTFQNFVIEKW